MRATLDKLISWTGLILAVVLLAAGGLLTWAHYFIGDQVEHQLGMQGITMPSGDGLKALPEEDAAALEKWADGETPMTNGAQAKAYADHYILVHMNDGTEGVYTQLQDLGVDTSTFPNPMTYQSAGSVSKLVAAQDVSDDVKAQAASIVGDFRTSTLFTGNTLRGLLLYGYAFATMGTIAGLAAIGAFLGALVMLVLGALGLRHAAIAQRANS